MPRGEAAVLLCPTRGHRSERDGRAASRAAGRKSLPPEIGEGKSSVLLEENAAEPFVCFTTVGAFTTRAL